MTSSPLHIGHEQPLETAGVSAVVVTFNSRNDLADLIESGSMNWSFDEVILVDNASTDDCVALARDAGWTVIALEENVGFAAGANVGVAATDTPYVAIMNPDIGIPEPLAVRELMRHFADPTVGLVAPRLRLPDGTIQDSARNIPQPVTLARRRLSGRAYGRVDGHAPIDVAWVVGAFLLVRRTAHLAVGGLDARYPLYFEDVDYCVRLWHAGWRVRYDPTVEFGHYHQAASRRKPFSQASRWHVQSAFRFYRRHPRYLFARKPMRPRKQWPSRRTTLYLAASPGGHIHLLRSAQQGFDGLTRTWVTAAGSHSEDLRKIGERVLHVPRVRGVTRMQAVRGALASAWLAIRERPELVITSGADMVIPFVLMSRLLGARIYYVESITRITTESRSGRIVGRWCERHFVQWPELKRRDNAVLVWPESLDELPPTVPTHRGTSTFVTVGTHTADFSRLTDLVVEAAEAGRLPTPVLIQHGFSRAPTSAAVTCQQWLTSEEVRRQYESAAVVITHAGSGSVLGALTAGLRPLVMARSLAHDEHVDDHQSELVRKFSELGLIIPIEDRIDAEMVEQTLRKTAVPTRPDDVPTLDAAIRAELEAIGAHLTAVPTSMSTST